MNIRQISLFALSAAAALVLGTATATAQEAAGNLAESWTFTVKSGHQAEFEAAFKAHAALRREHDDPRTWDTFVPVTGDDMNRYSVRTCCFAWPDQDAYEQWYRDNPDVMAHWNTDVDPHVASYGHHFYEMNGANSHWPEDSGPVRFVGVTEFPIATGHGADFAAARQQVSQIAINQGWTEGGHRWAWMDRVGGEPASLLAVAFGSYADMAPDGPTFYEFLSEHLGAQGAEQLMEQLSDSTRGSSYSIWAHRPDLSAP